MRGYGIENYMCTDKAFWYILFSVMNDIAVNLKFCIFCKFNSSVKIGKTGRKTLT